jgi:hypothetical protein
VSMSISLSLPAILTLSHTLEQRNAINNTTPACMSSLSGFLQRGHRQKRSTNWSSTRASREQYIKRTTLAELQQTLFQ